MVTLDRIYHASTVLKGVARRTDLIEAAALENGCRLFLKTENLQLTGSFKLRGAYYKISRLSEEEKAAGILACSAGNHAQGVALAASRAGLKSVVCMPDGAPISKVEATKAFGAEVVLVKGGYDDAYAHACSLQRETGMTMIHPFNDEDVIAGQGTIGLEIMDQLPEAEVILVPVGGGGLISGVACAVKTLNPNVRVIGVQAAGAPSMRESLGAHEPVTLPKASTFADGIAVRRPGDLTYAMVREYVDEIVTVTEDEIAAAILALLEKQKMIAEGAGAVSLAAVLSGKVDVAGKNVVCLISGGNIDVNILSRVISRGLITTGRRVTLQIALEDKPGQLVEVSSIVAACGANVISVVHNVGNAGTAVTSCYLTLGLETRDAAQIAEIREKLTAAGFTLTE
ncbi:MAG: threonine ammonia-lyase [Clostridia bacterium]|nr:threonine ammonia-lyase [Clostridia bacterium]MBR4458072.1 threonine ammonia-lyase [Clostridia bacterium]